MTVVDKILRSAQCSTPPLFQRVGRAGAFTYQSVRIYNGCLVFIFYTKMIIAFSDRVYRHFQSTSYSFWAHGTYSVPGTAMDVNTSIVFGMI